LYFICGKRQLRILVLLIILVTIYLPGDPLIAQALSNQNPVEFCSTLYLLNISPYSDLNLKNDTRNSPIDRTNYLDAVRDLGVRHIRDEVMSWENIQPTRQSSFQFEVVDDFVIKAAERGISIMALFYWLPAWATVDDEPAEKFPKHGAELLPKRKYENDFRQYIKTVVRRYCGRYPESLDLQFPVKEWVFMNEPEYSPLNDDIENYAFWLKIFYKEIKDLDPDAVVVAPAISCNRYFEKKFLARLLDCEALKGPFYPYFDVCDFHAYPQWPSHYPHEELWTYDEAFAHVRTVLAEHNITVPIWLTETGYRCADPDKQARQMVKNLVHAATTGVARVYQFGFWDIGHEQGHWGFLENTPSGQVPVRKPYFYAYQTLIRKIGENRSILRLWPGIYEVILRGEQKVYVMWKEGETFDPSSLISGRIRITNLKGREILMSIEDLELSDSPLFIEEQEGKHSPD